MVAAHLHRVVELMASEDVIQDSGFFNPKERPKPVTGSGPGFARALEAYNKRLEEQAKVGKWRLAPASWKHNDGSYIDCDWCVL